MTGLIIDTSGPWLNLAVCREENILAQTSQLAGNRQAEILPAELVSVLSAADLALPDLSWLAVTAGPGSFTGLRVGISFTQGLAMSSGIRLISLNTLDAMSFLPEGFIGELSPMLDAKKGQVYTALYRSEKGACDPISEYQVVEPECWLSRLAPKTRVFGNGAYACREMIAGSYPELEMDEIHVNGPEIRGLAMLAAKKLRQGDFIPADELDAFYIRPSDAVVKHHD